MMRYISEAIDRVGLVFGFLKFLHQITPDHTLKTH